MARASKLATLLLYHITKKLKIRMDPFNLFSFSKKEFKEFELYRCLNPKIYEDKDKYIVKILLPEKEKERNIKIFVNENSLEIDVARISTQEFRCDEFISGGMMLNGYGSKKYLSERVDIEKIKVSYKGNVIGLIIPKEKN